MYKGVLRSTGELVAVKVQRPGIGDHIAIDMLLLRRLMAVIDKNQTVVRFLHLCCVRFSWILQWKVLPSMAVVDKGRMPSLLQVSVLCMVPCTVSVLKNERECYNPTYDVTLKSSL